MKARGLENQEAYLEGSLGRGGCGGRGNPGCRVWVCVPAAAATPPLALQATARYHVCLLIIVLQFLLAQAGRRPDSQRPSWLRAQVQWQIVFGCTGRMSVHCTVIVSAQAYVYFFFLQTLVNPYPTAFPYGNGMVLHFYQQQESSTTKTVHKVINKGLKTYV